MIIEEVKKTLLVLQQGGIILYPTDTVWGIGCDATNPNAVQKIYTLKRREETKSMICLVNTLDMLNNFVEKTPDAAINFIKTAKKPTTIIYDNPKQVASNLIASDNTLAIRVVNTEFCDKLIKLLGKPLVSTSANISGEPTPKSFEEISEQILKGVDYVVNLPREKSTAQPSTIIKINSNEDVTIIRE